MRNPHTIGDKIMPFVWFLVGFALFIFTRSPTPTVRADKALKRDRGAAGSLPLSYVLELLKS
jgi:hypothetical protein